MADDGLRYEVLVERALRGVLREALSYIAEHGLPGDHHFYISFRTNDPGVDIPAQLRSRYPSEMTIVLQYQFWDLEVTEDRFEVKLSFNNIPERLVVPFSAVRAFFDPSVQFGLQFGTPGPANDSSRSSPAIAGLVGDGDAPAGLPMVAERSGEDTAPEQDEAAEEPAAGPEPVEQPMAEVVELDMFRKK